MHKLPDKVSGHPRFDSTKPTFDQTLSTDQPLFQDLLREGDGTIKEKGEHKSL